MKKLLIALVLGPLAAGAHDPGLSSATIDFSSREILVQVSFAPSDLGALKSAGYGNLAPRSVELSAANLPIRASSVEVREVGSSDVEFVLRFPRPAREVVMRSPLLASLPLGHRQVLTVRDPAGTLVQTEMLSADRATVSLPHPGAEPSLPWRLPQHPGAVLAATSAFALVAIWLARRGRRGAALPASVVGHK